MYEKPRVNVKVERGSTFTWKSTLKKLIKAKENNTTATQFPIICQFINNNDITSIKLNKTISFNQLITCKTYRIPGQV